MQCHCHLNGRLLLAARTVCASARSQHQRLAARSAHRDTLGQGSQAVPCQDLKRDLHGSATIAGDVPGPTTCAAAQEEQSEHRQAYGSIHLILGPMFAGKTSELLNQVANYEAAGRRVAVLKSCKDDRYHATNLTTHDGLSRPCYALTSLRAFKDAMPDSYREAEVIAIDEAQFFPDLQQFCTDAADCDGKLVILAGLDGDFRRRRFGQVLDLIPVADSVTKLTANCAYCASRALFSLRIAADDRQEVVGGADKYAPVCRQHYVSLSQLRADAAPA